MKLVASFLVLSACVSNSSVTVDGTTSVGSGGDGTGTVVSAPAGIDCTITAGAASGDCSASFSANTVVTLTATPAASSTFTYWLNMASGTDFDYEQTLGFSAQPFDATNPLPLDVDNDRDLVVLPTFEQ
ncbi:MAG TPA: hypothetical protein VGL61_23455 [Kofleriaceae bacterium]